jgi:ATP-dependent RNA helicase DHX29
LAKTPRAKRGIDSFEISIFETHAKPHTDLLLVDAERFSKYLDGASVLNVPGRTFPVQVRYLEDAVELTGYNLDNGQQERFTDLDDEVDAVDGIANDATKAENTKALRGYSNKTKNTIAQIDEYRVEFDLVTQLLAKIATDERFEIFSKAVLVSLNSSLKNLPFG